jgi:hypothetical protein
MGEMLGSGVAPGDAVSASPGEVPVVAAGLSGGTVAGASVVCAPQAASDNISNNANAIEKTLVMIPLIVYD